MKSSFESFSSRIRAGVVIQRVVELRTAERQDLALRLAVEIVELLQSRSPIRSEPSPPLTH